MNIFVCQTPFQLFYAFLLIRKFGKEKYCIIHSDLDLSNYEIGSHGVTMNTKEKGLSIIGSVFNYRRIIKQINNFNKTEKQIAYFIPHVGGLIANYIYHNKKVKEINFFYEGVLYFYDFIEPYNKNHFKRTVLGLAIGFTYRHKKVIYPYRSTKIKHIYTPIKLLTKGNKEKIIEVKFDTSKINKLSSKSYLIIGGPVPYSKLLYESAIESILKDDESPKIYYKGHSSFLTHNKTHKNEFLEISKKYKIIFEELNILEPVEVSLTKIHVTHIISYFSSALVNFNLIKNNNIDVLCYNDGKLNDDLKKVINHFKIKMIHV